jgi:hypothetical protein
VKKLLTSLSLVFLISVLLPIGAVQASGLVTKDSFSQSAATTGSTPAYYVPFGPVRIVDSRIGQGIASKLIDHTPVNFAVAGVADIPTDAVAVTGNLTVTEQNHLGYVTLSPTPNANPTTSTLNLPLNDNRANGVYLALGPGGILSAVTVSMNADIIFDVTGYFTTTTIADSWYPVTTPTRLLDTRFNVGLTGAFNNQAPRSLQVAGVGGIPANALAITGNITATGHAGTEGLGYFAVTTAPTTSPTTSTLNFPSADTRANNLVAPLAANGTLSIVYIGVGSENGILDVTGYFLPDGNGGLYVPLAPVRVLDSRIGLGALETFTPAQAGALPIAGGNGVDPAALAVTGNLTATTVTSSGYGYITPITTPTPPTSNLNVPPGDNRANGFVSALGPDGSLGVGWNAYGSANLIMDLTGYFVGAYKPPFVGMSLYRHSAWSYQATSVWCVAASTQMMINLITGRADHSSANQGAYLNYAYSHSRYKAKAGAEVDGWANAVTYYSGVPYQVSAYPTFTAAMKAAATRMRLTDKSVGLVVMEGHHAWVMAGFTSTGDDPAVSQNFTLTSVTIMAPDYGRISYDPVPGSVVSLAYMQGKLTGYTDDFLTIWDHQYVIVNP